MTLAELASLHRAGQLRQAEEGYRSWIDRHPDDPQAIHLLGLILHQTGRTDEALVCLRRSVELAPNAPDFLSNLAGALGGQGHHHEAAALLSKAVHLKPEFPAAWNNLGVALEHLGRHAQGEQAYRQAIRLDPKYPEPHNHLGNVLRAQGRMIEAIESHERAIRLRPTYADAYNGLAADHGALGNAAEAVACHRKLAELRPGSAAAHSDYLHTLHYLPEVAQRSLFDEALRWNERHGRPLAHLAHPHPNTPDPDRVLRVGFVSPDFREHPIARLMRPILQYLDRSAIEPICYSDVSKPDDLTAELQARCPAWRSIVGMSDEQVERLIRADRIDLLVDLTGHMAGNRLTLFARRPAPVQITHFNYPDTTGLCAMDYRISDATAEPPGESDALSTERILRLPNCAWCYDPPADAPDPGPLPARTRGDVTFICLNKPIKITPAAIALWSQLLLKIEGSRLVLHSGSIAPHNPYLASQFARHGVDTDRLAFRPTRCRADHLADYLDADIALDPFPYNGGITSCDTLWMGVPLLSVVGQTYRARQGMMLLSNVGLADLATDEDAFIPLASALASGLPRLSLLRSTLRDRMRKAPVTNGASFARALEHAFRSAWRSWCAASPV